MIDDPPLLKVRRHFRRPDPAVVQLLRDTPTGFVVDCMNGRGALDYRIKAVDDSAAQFVGTAVTCHAGPGDNLAIFAALELAGPGDVIVAATDQFTATSVAGDLLLGMVRNKGGVGFVTDGLVRDLVGIEQVGLPAFSMGITPNSPARNGPGTAGLPIHLGGVGVDAGDVVIADRDGVVVVPQRQLVAVCQHLPKVRGAEAYLDRQVKNGLDHMAAVRQLMASDRIEHID